MQKRFITHHQAEKAKFNSRRPNTTRSESFIKSRVFSESQAQRIYNFIKDNPHATREEISTKLKLRHSSVTARVSELLNSNLIEVSGDTTSPSGMKHETLVIAADFNQPGKSKSKSVKVPIALLEGLIESITKFEEELLSLRSKAGVK